MKGKCVFGKPQSVLFCGLCPNYCMEENEMEMGHYVPIKSQQSCACDSNDIKKDCVYYSEEIDMGAHIPCCEKHASIGNCLCGECNKYLAKQNAMTIYVPKNSTNGNIIERLFPDCIKDNDFGGAVITVINGETQYWKKTWWNAPYTKEKTPKF